jgi:hypothetical protein
VSKNHLPAILRGIVFSISAGVGSAEDSTVQGKGQIDEKSFRCITEMTHVRQFYVDNLLGNLDATLAVANSATGGTGCRGSTRTRPSGLPIAIEGMDRNRSRHQLLPPSHISSIFRQLPIAARVEALSVHSSQGCPPDCFRLDQQNRHECQFLSHCGRL